MRRIVKAIRDIWVIAGLSLLFFGLVEGILSLVYLSCDPARGPRQGLSDSRCQADTYVDPTWVNEYYIEDGKSRNFRWQSYVYWRREPVRGTYVNIDADGVRRTHEAGPKRPGSHRPLNIFMFGGSTMWGTGARDDFTIPSLLEKELQDKGVACVIRNFGESAYVSTQEIITLMLQLEKNRVPDLAIFYDGANDLFSALQQKKAGLPQNEYDRVKEFNLAAPTHLRRRILMLAGDISSRLSTVRQVRDLLKRFKGNDKDKSSSGPVRSGEPDSDDSNLPRETIDAYLHKFEHVEALSKHYRFRYLVYWQPTIFEKKHLTEYEKFRRHEARVLEPFFRDTYDAVRQMNPGRDRIPFRDISRIFADLKDPVFVDWCHLGESGNEMVAKRIARDVITLFPRSVVADHRGD